MCGIAGLVRPQPLTHDDPATLDRMQTTIAHRGPDGHDIWMDKDAGVGLAHRRLAIIDLSETGRQPMKSHSGRLVITFNGEIYNYEDLREELETVEPGLAWVGSSDTEVLLQCIEVWGVTKTLPKLRGMFAFAVWDRSERQMFFARDAMGEKPLYFGRLNDGGLAFASELKALKAVPSFDSTIDWDAAASALRIGYIPAPLSIYRSTKKVAPGELVTVRLDQHGALATSRTLYFDLQAEARHAALNPFQGDAQEATGELDRLLSQSVSRQMVSDVPLGAFLSGGVDSATVSSMMVRATSSPVQTFTLGFDEDGENEAPYAKEVARFLQTDHHEIVLKPDKAIELVETMPQVYDEPFSDPSQLPTFLVSKFARERVTVCLTGDGADELFAGYGRHHSLAKRWNDTVLSNVLRLGERTLKSAFAGRPGPLSSADGSVRLETSDRIKDIQSFTKLTRLSADNPVEAYDLGYSHWLFPELLIANKDWTASLTSNSNWSGGKSALHQLTQFDMARYLPDNILVKVDRASMATSLETRAPFLDPDLVRFAMALPDPVRLSGGDRKGLVKAVLGQQIPRHLWDRPKQGFGIPLAQWLNGPLKPLAESMFSKASLQKSELLDEHSVPLLWQSFKDGNKKLNNIVWSLLLFQLTFKA